MRTFNYSAIKDQKWDSEILGLVAGIYKYAGKQELYLKQKPHELEKLVEIAKIQSTEASNAIEGIVTTNTRIRQLVDAGRGARLRLEPFFRVAAGVQRQEGVHALRRGRSVPRRDRRGV